MDTIKIAHGNTKVIAHRGLSGLETENSIPAFVAAGNRSYFGVETDVHVTADGRFVIIHDDVTGRVARQQAEVETSSYERLREIRLRDLCPAADRVGWDWQELENRQDLVIPNLKEYISICKKYGKTCVLELKNPFAPEDMDRLLEEIRALGYLEHMVFISFCLDNMVYLRKCLPKQELYYLSGEYTEAVHQALVEHRLHLDVHYPALTREIVEALHREGIRINCWTCDDREAAERLVSWGVDYITSNILE